MQKRLYLVMEGELQVSKGGNDIAPVRAGEFAGEVREDLTSSNAGPYICCVSARVSLTGFATSFSALARSQYRRNFRGSTPQYFVQDPTL